MDNVHPIFADILARFSQVPSMNTKKTPKQIVSIGKRQADAGNCRVCRVCGKGPVPIARMTFNGEYGQFVHPACYRKWQKQQ